MKAANSEDMSNIMLTYLHHSRLHYVFSHSQLKTADVRTDIPLHTEGI